jgi:hypothetical protein
MGTGGFPGKPKKTNWGKVMSPLEKMFVIMLILIKL